MKLLCKIGNGEEKGRAAGNSSYKLMKIGRTCIRVANYGILELLIWLYPQFINVKYPIQMFYMLLNEQCIEERGYLKTY